MSNLLLLPSELKHCIAELCSPGALSALARTHTACQIEAEQALYRTIFIVAYKNNYLKCLDTLATNPEKASYVHVLSVQSTFEYDCNGEIMTRVLRGLINMHSLDELRLRIFLQESPEAKRQLNDILCGDHFRLKNLYCHFNFNYPSLEISRIIKNQTELQILVMYHDIDDLLPTLQQIHDLQSFLPMVVTVELSRNHICIFPAFYSADRIAMIHQVLVESLDNDQMVLDIDSFDSLSIFLIDSSKLSTIHALAKETAVSFPQITALSFSFKDQCEIPAQEMKEIITSFSKLQTLDFGLWPGPRHSNLVPRIPEDIKKAHVKEWTVVCPELDSVTFMDYFTFYKIANEDDDEWSD